MSIDSLIQAAADEVQATLDKLFDSRESIAVDSNLDALGLRDGRVIVLDYLKHGEPGLAFEHVIYMITEVEIPISFASYKSLVSAGKKMKIDPSTWADVRFQDGT